MDKTTASAKLSELSLEQLVQLSQGLGHQIDKLREQRLHLKVLIDKRLAAGESESKSGADATAPGATIVATAKKG